LVRLALIAALVPALLLAGCGSDDEVPSGAVAVVDGQAIDQRSFDHWMTVAAKTSGRPADALPKPPDFAGCVKAKQSGKPVEGQPKVTDSEAREQCREEYDGLRAQVIGLLVTSRWLEAEARERRITVTDADVKERFEMLREQQFPKAKQYRKFLADSGQSEADVLLRVRVDLLNSKLQEQVTKGADKVSERQVTDYYNRHRDHFAQPETRDVRLVLTGTVAKAKRTRAALARGASWKRVAKRFSLDAATKKQGGKLTGITQGQQEKALDDAIFGAAKGKLTGPVETQFGHYVFEVTRVSEADQQTRDQAAGAIKQILISEKRQKLFDDFMKEFREKWRAKTRCDEELATQDCANAPEPEATLSDRSGGAQPGSPQS
jgi:foldase protein PrsA